MKKKQLLLPILFLISAVFAALVFLQNREGEASSGQNDWDFAVANPEQIGRIFLADREGNTTLLEQKAGKWWVNQDYPASPNAMDNLLDAIERIRLKYRPPAAAVPGMISSLSTEGIKVEIYDTGGKKIKAYYIGGATPDERGTYAIMENADNPYVAHIPAWEGNLRFRFNLLGDDWKDKTVFGLRQEDINRVAVTYPRQRNKSFVLERQGNSFAVTPAYELVPENRGAVNRGAVERYLRNYNSLVAESFANQYPDRDSIVNLIPFCTVAIATQQGNQTVHFFPIFPRPGIDLKTGQVGNPQDVERYYAYMEEKKDFMLVQQRVFRNIFQAYEGFFD
jgi:hypothetical protein